MSIKAYQRAATQADNPRELEYRALIESKVWETIEESKIELTTWTKISKLQMAN